VDVQDYCLKELHAESRERMIRQAMAVVDADDVVYMNKAQRIAGNWRVRVMKAAGEVLSRKDLRLTARDREFEDEAVSILSGYPEITVEHYLTGGRETWKAYMT
jgi:hypothetical protein